MSPIQGQISHREHDLREMLLRSAGKLFQDVGYVQASIYRIASAINAPKGTFYNYFRSKEDLASSGDSVEADQHSVLIAITIPGSI